MSNHQITPIAEGPTWQNAQPETFLYEEMFLIGMWAGNDNRGQTETLEKALDAIRERAPADEWIYDRPK